MSYTFSHFWVFLGTKRFVLYDKATYGLHHKLNNKYIYFNLLFITILSMGLHISMGYISNQ